MDQHLENYDSSKYDNNIKAPMRVTKSSKRSKKCNQCNYGSSHAGNLRTHLKTHSEEKSN